MSGEIYIPAAGAYRFAVDGDDSIDVTINGTTIGWYKRAGPNRTQDGLNSHSSSINFAAAGWYRVVFRHVDGSSNDNWGLAWQVNQQLNNIEDFNIRLKACTGVSSALQEASCKQYGAVVALLFISRRGYCMISEKMAR